MFTITSAPASASSLAGGPGSQMSSQTVRPMVVAADADHGGRAADLEVALLVEHPVVGQEDLAVDRPDLSVRQHGERVVDVLGGLREPDQGDHAPDVGGDVVERLHRPAARKCVFSSRSSGGYPFTASSGKTASCAPLPRARAR